jgi:tripartite-type tricarboxylate transporter receptor subunit TctC
MKKLFLSLALCLSVSAFAETKIIVPTVAGGAVDNVARLFSKFINKTEEPSVIENFGGAGGIIGTQQFLSSPPNTLMLSSGSLYLNILEGKFQQDDFKFVSIVAEGPLFLLASKQSTVSCQDLREGKRYYFIGHGGGPTGLLTKAVSNNHKHITEVPYKGVKQAEMDLLGSRLDAVVGLDTSDVYRPLANSSSRVVDGIPTIRECLTINQHIVMKFILVASPGSSDQFVRKINALVVQFADDPETKKILGDYKMIRTATDVANTTKQVKQDLQNWKTLVK